MTRRSRTLAAFALLALLPACTEGRDAAVTKQSPVPDASPSASPRDRLLVSIGDVGSVTWRCLTPRSKLVRFSAAPGSATEQVTVLRPGHTAPRRTVNPADHVTLRLVRGPPSRLKIVQATEPRTITARVRLGYGHSRACLEYVPPIVHVDVQTRHH